MLELLFVGAGPHSLATLARLLESSPDPGVDAPQRHVVPKERVLSYWQWQRTCPTYRATLREWLQEHVAVVDPSGDWMSRWHQQFAALGISYLRSTTAVHPDPLDSYALATYASSTGRTAELMPLEHIEKSPAFAGPFAVPGTQLFTDFCSDLVHRYCLEGIVITDKVAVLSPVFCSNDPAAVDHWTVQLSSGKQLTAKRVILGIGSTNMQRLPEAVQHLQPIPHPKAPSSSSSNSASTACKDTPADSSSSSAVSVSECCSGCCDGACSNSSGWSFDSTQTHTAADVLVAASTAASAAASVSNIKAAGAAAAAAAALGDDSSSSSISSPRSTCDSLCSWLELEQQQQLQHTAKRPAPLVIDSSSNSDAGSSSSATLSDAIATSLLSWGLLQAEAPALGTAAAGGGGVANGGQAIAAAAAPAAMGPQAWVSAASSPTSACDSLCSWLGCEHTAAQLSLQQQQQQVQQVELAAGMTEAELSAGQQQQQQQRLSVNAGASSSCPLINADCTLLAGDPGFSMTEHVADVPQSQLGMAGEPDCSSAVPAAACSAGACSTAGVPQAAPAEAEAACPEDNTYPYGRLMHAWQLVQALNTTSSTAAAAAAAELKGSAAAEAEALCPEACSTTSSSTSAAVAAANRTGGFISGSSRRRVKSRKGLDSDGSSRSKLVSKASSRFATQTAAALLQQKGLLQPGESVLIIGGGLTTAHLAALAAAGTAASTAATRVDSSSSHTSRSSNSKLSNSSSSSSEPGRVTLLLRGPMRVKQFDVDIEWMGRNRGSTLQFGFRQLTDMGDRLKLMKRVLQGGSVTPEAAAVLSELRGRGVLEVQEHREVLDVAWDWEQQQWDVMLEDGDVLHADRLWLATGSSLSAPAEPLLAPLLKHLPIPLVSGLPALQPTLEWSPQSGLYLLGAYAALQLGPGALNLAGAKTASVIVAQQLCGELPALPAAVMIGVGGYHGGDGGGVRRQGGSGRAMRAKQRRNA